MRLAHVALFVLAAGVCVLAMGRVRDLDPPDVRRGMWWLFLTVGAWALFEAGRIATTSESLAVLLYLGGLTAGIATVGAWLYFCSAYAGRPHHTKPAVRRFALATFLLILAVKYTNPIHGLYFETVVRSAPFEYVAVRYEAVSWIVTGLAYALSTVGFYMLFDLFVDIDRSVRFLGGLFALNALPAVFSVAGAARLGPFVQLSYEPIGVAAFAIGVLYVADDRFLAVQRQGRRAIAESTDDGVVILDRSDRIRHANRVAKRLFPALGESTEEAALDSIEPRLHRACQMDDPLLEVTVDGSSTWVAVSETPLPRGQHDAGRALVLTEVTERITRQRERKQQNEYLDDFANAVTHELRNALNVVINRLEIAERRLPADQDGSQNVSLAREAAVRSGTIVDDLVKLARTGKTTDDFGSYDFRTLAAEARSRAAADDFSVQIEGDGTIEADRQRLLELFGDAIRFARGNEATSVTIGLESDGFVVTDDGRRPPADRRDDLFAFGVAIPDAETGRVLAMVHALARAHGWNVDLDATFEDGFRYRITGVTVKRRDESSTTRT